MADDAEFDTPDVSPITIHLRHAAAQLAIDVVGTDADRPLKDRQAGASRDNLADPIPLLTESERAFLPAAEQAVHHIYEALKTEFPDSGKGTR